MSERTRVLYISHMSSLSGAEVALVGLLSRLDRELFEPIVAMPSEERLAPALAALGVRTVVTPLAWWIPATHWSREVFVAQGVGLASRVERLVALARSEGVALIHSNTIVSLEGAVAAAELGLPHVWHSRGFFSDGFPPAYFAGQSILFGVVDLLSDAVLSTSEPVAAQARESCRVAPVEVVHDGLDLASFLGQPVGTRDELCARHGIDPGARLIACVGGVQRRKGLLDLVEAIARLAPRFPRLKVLLCGPISEPAYRDAVERRADELGVRDALVFLGLQGNVLGVLRHCELLVSPSFSEGFGLAVLEAMAAGLPVVATRCGGPEAIVEDGVSGFLVPVGSSEEIASAIGRLLDGTELARTMGRAAEQRSRAFSLEATARRVEAVYRSLLARGDGPWLAPARARFADLVRESFVRATEPSPAV